MTTFHCDRQKTVQHLKDIAVHQLELVHQQLLTTQAHNAILSTVASFTWGINPKTRWEQWSSFVAAYEVIRDLNFGFYDTAAVLAYANVDSPDPLDVYDRSRVWAEATQDMAEAIDALLVNAGRLHLVGAS